MRKKIFQAMMAAAGAVLLASLIIIWVVYMTISTVCRKSRCRMS